jgi:hypothetical protein
MISVKPSGETFEQQKAVGPCRAFDVYLEIEEIGAVNLGTAGTYALTKKVGKL